MIAPTRLADTLRYDAGIIRLADSHGSPAEYADSTALAAALATLPQRAAWPFVAGYGLAQTARAWRGRPSDARRGAIIQAGEQLRLARADDIGVRQFIERGLACADAAIFDGEDAEAALLALVTAALRRADRADERCGRHAAGLLDAEDHVLVVGGAHPALLWALHLARAALGSAPQIAVADAELTETLQSLGLPVALLTDAQISAGFAAAQFSVVIAAAAHAARDGSVAAAEVQRYAARARQQHVPCYVLAASGPDPDLPTGDGYLAPDLISAIVTDRGIYRAAMLARYLADGDTPIDVIPLIS